MNIRKKLIILGLVTLIGLGIILAANISGLNTIRESEETAHRRESYAVDLVEIKASALSSIMLDPSQKETRDIFSEAEKNISLHGNVALQAIKRESIRNELKNILKQWGSYDQTSQAIIKLAMTDLKSANDKITPLYNSEFKPFQSALEKFVSARQAEALQARNEALEDFNKVYWTLIVLELIVALIMIAVLMNVSIGLQKGLQGIQEKLIPLKQGDLTQRLPENSKNELGEIGAGVNAFIQELQNIVQRTRDRADLVSSSAQHLASA